MPRSHSVLIPILILISACAPATQAAPVIDNATTTPSPIPTATQTWLPTETPTASITPLPTIPTFTPTFDVSTIVTVTPGPKAECPKEKSFPLPEIKNDTKISHIYNSQELLNILNTGTSFKTLSNIRNQWGFKLRLTSQDVTGDQIPDLLFIDTETIDRLNIYICSDAHYILYSPEINYFGWDTEIVAVKDLDSDGIPEIILKHRGCSGNGCYSINILEWNGNDFQVMNTSPQYGVGMDGLVKVEIKDLNKDGIFEILMTGGIPALGAYIINPPWRLETEILAWNGKVFSLKTVKYETPQFRFQGIQDGDRETLSGNFVDATKSYQEVIFNENLEWWSSQRQIDTIIKLGNEGYSALGIPAPGTPDLAEYPRLAAYAYYRIMLLHLVQGNESDAGTIYNTLQQKFGSDSYGRPYVEIATAFWEAYQSTHKMYDGCAAAIQYAAEHPDILIPLGSDYHGWQSHTYVPADVCPFR